MAKKMVHVGGGGGIEKKRIIKQRKKKSIHKVIDYLLSDCYLFAPLLISPSSPFHSNGAPRKGIQIGERTEDNRSLVKKIQDYLKSDCYMYASLVAPQSLRVRVRAREHRKTGCVGVGYVKKVSREVSTTTSPENYVWKEKRICSTDLVLDHQPNATTPNSSSLSISGEGKHNPKMRKIVVD